MGLVGVWLRGRRLVLALDRITFITFKMARPGVMVFASQGGWAGATAHVHLTGCADPSSSSSSFASLCRPPSLLGSGCLWRTVRLPRPIFIPPALQWRKSTGKLIYKLIASFSAK